MGRVSDERPVGSMRRSWSLGGKGRLENQANVRTLGYVRELMGWRICQANVLMYRQCFSLSLLGQPARTALHWFAGLLSVALNELCRQAESGCAD